MAGIKFNDSQRTTETRIGGPNWHHHAAGPPVSPSPAYRRDQARLGLTVICGGHMQIVRSPLDLEDDFAGDAICDDLVVLDHAFHFIDFE